MTDDLCGHLRLKGDAAKLRGRRIGCGFGAESLTIKGEASAFLAVRRSAFGDDAPPTLTLSDGTSEVARNVDELFRGGPGRRGGARRRAETLGRYIPAPPELRRGDVVELEPWARGGAVPRRRRWTCRRRGADPVRVAWTPAPPASVAMQRRSRGRRCARAPYPGRTPARAGPRRSATPKPDGAAPVADDVDGAGARRRCVAAGLAVRGAAARRARRSGVPGALDLVLSVLIRAPRTARAQTHCGSSS